jgi:ABC-type multidrug transport system fused ATPase/permease subunit
MYTGHSSNMTAFQKLWKILTPSQRRASAKQLALIFIGMLLETLGIGLVIPALILMTQSDIVTKYPSISIWLSIFDNFNREELVIIGMLALTGIYGIKVLFLGFLTWRQARFVLDIQASLSQRLFAGYLRQPYVFHLQHNSAQLIRNVIGHVGEIINVIRQTLTLITEGLVLIAISVLLLVMEPLGAIFVVSLLGLASWALNHFTRGHILKWGIARQYHEGLRIQNLQEGLGAAKDVKLLGREDDFLTQYQVHNFGSAEVGQYQITLQGLPRLWLELLAVIGLAILVVIMISSGKPLDALLPTIGLFAAAAFRLLPSVNRVIGAIQGVRFFLPVVETMYSEICLADKTVPIVSKKSLLTFKKEITLENLSFKYPMAATEVLKNISLSIPFGRSVGFIGSSGAGKSTLVDIILGLLSPSTGAVKIDGVDIQNNLRGWQDQIGYVSQAIFLTDDTLRRNIAFGLSNQQINEDAIWQALQHAQLDQFVKNLPEGLDTKVGERGVRLSGGQRQRIGIARALYHDPSVLVLDEATSSLDNVIEHDVMEAVNALHGNKTIIVVAHRLRTVERCDHLYQLEHGKIHEVGVDSVTEKVSRK